MEAHTHRGQRGAAAHKGIEAHSLNCRKIFVIIIIIIITIIVIIINSIIAIANFTSSVRFR